MTRPNNSAPGRGFVTVVAALLLAILLHWAIEASPSLILASDDPMPQIRECQTPDDRINLVYFMHFVFPPPRR